MKTFREFLAHYKKQPVQPVQTSDCEPKTRAADSTASPADPPTHRLSTTSKCKWCGKGIAWGQVEQAVEYKFVPLDADGMVYRCYGPIKWDADGGEHGFGQE